MWTSIAFGPAAHANPARWLDLSYYTGKTEVERLVRESGIPYAILRPTCFFGHGGLLIENIAWAARRLPLVPILSGPRYWIRPIHVEDYAAAVAALEASDSWTRDATGPDRIEFGDLIRLLANITGGDGRPARLPLALCHLAYAAASRAAAATILTVDELKGLPRNLPDFRCWTVQDCRLQLPPGAQWH